MKKILFAAVALISLAACSHPVQKVNARHVPERMDDFVFENDYYCFRVYGEALEGNPTSPGFDFWAKNCDTLVAEGRYALYASGSDEAYHHDSGNGKDCYKVAVSLGAGASSPFIDGSIRYPATNYRSYEVLSLKPSQAVFVLHYPAWETCGYTVSLDKKFTVTAGERFCKVEDTYTFTGPSETLVIAAGINRHKPEDLLDEYIGTDRVAIWERASDQSFEPEDGLIGVAVIVPGAGCGDVTSVCKGCDGNGMCAESCDGCIGICPGCPDSGATVACGHSLVLKPVRSGEPLTYYFSAVWSKYDIPTAEDWFETVAAM